MKNRGYNVAIEWYNPNYCGKKLGIVGVDKVEVASLIYPKHNQTYLNECIDNLKKKGIKL